MRESGRISGRLPDDPGGFTCMNHHKGYCTDYCCRADKNPYRPDGRADKDSYRHDRRADSHCHSDLSLI